MCGIWNRFSLWKSARWVRVAWLDINHYIANEENEWRQITQWIGRILYTFEMMMMRMMMSTNVWCAHRQIKAFFQLLNWNSFRKKSDWLGDSSAKKRITWKCFGWNQAQTNVANGNTFYVRSAIGKIVSSSIKAIASSHAIKSKLNPYIKFKYNEKLKLFFFHLAIFLLEFSTTNGAWIVLSNVYSQSIHWCETQ